MAAAALAPSSQRRQCRHCLPRRTSDSSDRRTDKAPGQIVLQCHTSLLRRTAASASDGGVAAFPADRVFEAELVRRNVNAIIQYIQQFSNSIS